MPPSQYEAPGGGIDPRLDRDGAGRTPHQLARARGNTNAMRLLDPSYPLSALSPRLDSMPADEFSLAAIAGAALRAKLSASLLSAEKILKAGAAAAAAARAQARMQAGAACSAPGHHQSCHLTIRVQDGASIGNVQGCQAGTQSTVAPNTASPIHTPSLPTPFSSMQASMASAAGSRPSDNGATSGRLSDSGTIPFGQLEGKPSMGSGTLLERLESKGSGVRIRPPRSPSGAGGSGTRSPEGSYHRGLLYHAAAGSQAGSGLIRRSLQTVSSNLLRKASAESSMSVGSAHRDPTRCETACGVCWDATAVVLISGCKHGLCLAVSGWVA